MKFIRLIVSLFLVYAIAFLGALVTYPSLVSWYDTLNQPFFTPPNWVFGPVWTLLYTLMGVALYMVWSEKSKNSLKSWAFVIFGVQLLLNFFWSYVFFGLHFPLIALMVIILLLLAIIITIKRFHAVSATAAYLLLPYAVWVAFAVLLNLGIVLLN